MLEWIATSSLLILVVLLLRAVLGKRISAGLRYALWAAVLVRLLVPVAFFTLPRAVPKLPDWTPLEAMQEENIYVLPVYSGTLEDSGVKIMEDGALGDMNSFGYPRLSDDGERVVRYADKISPMELLRWMWGTGVAVMGAVLIVTNLRFSARLRRLRKPLEGSSAPVPVYVASGLPSPCLMGLVQPAVYVTEDAAADPAMLRHVLAHELTHYNHLDHLWSVLRGAALAVHWWNPLVWTAVVCSRRDGELACDEGALKRLGDGERTAYGETLLSLVTARSKPGDLLCFATTMSGGKRSLKERIQRIACQPKTLVSAMVVVVAVAVLSSVVAFGQAKETSDDGVPVDPAADDARLGDAWKAAVITVDTDGTPHIHYTLSDGNEETWNGVPIPAPRAWVDDDLAGRNEATVLTGTPDIWAKLVSPEDGWLVACYERGVAAADTYVYRTADRGVTWTEVTMPGTSWHIADVGFLSPDRLIVAQRIFDGAPCFITKDGGESWEEIELPDKVVTAIHSETVTMFVGPNETDPETYVMTSEDLGDHWTITPVGPPRSVQADLDHDGIPDTLDIWHTGDSGFNQWTLQFTASHMSSPAWEDEAATPHAGWRAFFLCRMDGEDYLLRYEPYCGGGGCYYNYKLFYLTASGEEVSVQENEIVFDLNFDMEGMGSHKFDPETIADFMDEINALLEHSTILVNTDPALAETFEREGRLYDSLAWLNDNRDEGLSLLENLRNYARSAEAYSGVASFPQMDLDHDGKPDELLLQSEPDSLGYSYDGTRWTLQCSLSGGGTWEVEGMPYLPGENAVFLYRMDGEDYLLVYTPYFWHGQGYYDYRLIWLDGGREVVVQENFVNFDARFRVDSVFEPEEIAAFMEDVNALLAGSIQLVNTNIYLQQVFDDEGRLYDSLYWLDNTRDDDLSLLENLQNYAAYAQDHPDDTWSPLVDLLEDLTEEDIPMFDGDTAGLVRMLQAGERGSRFYTWSSEADAYLGHGADEVDYTIWNIPLADGNTLWLMACAERASVLVILETQDGTYSAFYDAPELRDAIIEDDTDTN